MACQTVATIVAVILMSAHFASTRRVQTEHLIHHPINVESAAVGKSSNALESNSAPSQASSMIYAGKDMDTKRITMWKWVSSGGPFTSLASAIYAHALRAGNDTHMQATDCYICYCSIAIFLVASFACTFRMTDWWRNRSQDMRSQYIHRGRVIYEWIQTSNTVTFFTKLPPGQTQESLEIKLWPKHAKIGRKGKIAFIKGGLYDAINVDQSCWNVSLKGELEITLVKEMEQEWPCVFTAHHPDEAIRDQVKIDQPECSQKSRIEVKSDQPECSQKSRIAIPRIAIPK